jgi:hypothetical protein
MYRFMPQLLLVIFPLHNKNKSHDGVAKMCLYSELDVIKNNYKYLHTPNSYTTLSLT